MSPAASAEGGEDRDPVADPAVGHPLRTHYGEELEQLRLQVELMGVRVDENLERMRTVLAGGAPALVDAACQADDEIDAMNVSLTERCYVLLARESPVASDLRLVVSVLRITAELERIGDLSLRVTKLAPEHDALVADPTCHDILVVMADEAVERYRSALRAWATQDLALATELTRPSSAMEVAADNLTTRLLQLEGPDAVRTALRVSVAARALDRIADHTVILAARLRYLITGEPEHLAAEVR